MPLFGSRERPSHVPRPHLAQRQVKYAYEVQVVKFQALRPLPSDVGIKVLWTRGSKTAITSERVCNSNCAVSFDEEQLSLICTLFHADDEASTQFAEKLCTFAVIEPRKRGVHTVGKCKVDMAPYAMEHDCSKPRALALDLVKSSQAVGTLHITLACRCVRR
jgi:hypothetical protein